MSRPPRRLLVVTGAAAAAVALAAAPALAHVTVSSPGATQGGYGVLTFRVPTESDTASTVGLKVQLPADAPLAFVSVKPKAGWTYTVTRAPLPTPVTAEGGERRTDRPSVVEWTAAPAAGIKPGEFDEFQLSVGPLPERESLAFKAIQTYGDGKVVSWIEQPAAGSTEEPEYPAPVLRLAAAGGGPAPVASGPAAGSSDPGNGPVAGAYALGGAGLLAGLAALARTLTRRRTPA